MDFLESSFPLAGFSVELGVGGVTEGTGVVSDPDLDAGAVVGSTLVVELLGVGLSGVGGASCRL